MVSRAPHRLQWAGLHQVGPEAGRAVRVFSTSRVQFEEKKPEVKVPDVKTEKPVVPDAKNPPAKLTLWQKVKKEAKHYWDGTKLLGYEVKVSTKLALKLFAGHKLSRREDRQLKRTLQDIVRIVPFSMFVIVPFAELLLPVALKLFPNMLPSTYESTTSKEKKRAKLFATRQNVSKYLRNTMSNSSTFKLAPHTEEQKKQFDEFLTLVHRGDHVPRELLLQVCTLFRDDVLLDNFDRAQLSAMARYMGMQPLGTSTVLRYLIRHRLRQIKTDDYIIDKEGVESLNSYELQSACRARGFNTSNVSIGRLREDLTNWVQLRLRDKVPSTLLVLSSAFTYGNHDLDSFYDGISIALSALPEEAYHETEVDIKDDAVTNEQRLEMLKEQEELIKDENKEEEDSGSNIKVDDTVDCDAPRCSDPDHNHTNPEHPDNDPKSTDGDAAANGSEKASPEQTSEQGSEKAPEKASPEKEPVASSEKK